MFIILLTSKLDSPPNTLTPSYFFTCMPLFLMLIILIRLSFGSKSGSLWWFGMRSDFCTFLLTVCPCLKEYGNTSYTISSRVGDSETNLTSIVLEANATVSRTNSQAYSATETADSSNQAHENNAKRLMHSLSQVFFRNKCEHNKDETPRQDPVISKLNIDTPD